MVLQLIFPRISFDQVWPLHPGRFFSVIPSELKDFEVQISVVDGIRLSEPKDFYSFKKIYAHSRALRPYHIIQNLGKAAKANQKERFEDLRRVFEETYLPAHSYAEYRIVERKWKVREAWLQGESFKKNIVQVVYEGEYRNENAPNF